MNDLISRADAIDTVAFGITYAKAFNKDTGEVRELFKESNDTLRDAISRLESLPSIASEIIHCKECKFAHMTTGGECKYCDVWFPDESEYLDGDYYCASAERSSDE